MKKYKCKDNDVIIKTIKRDGVIDELHLGVEGDSRCGYTVVSIDDITEVLRPHIKNILIDFQYDLCNAGLIGDAAWSFDKVAKEFVKSLPDSFGEIELR